MAGKPTLMENTFLGSHDRRVLSVTKNAHDLGAQGENIAAMYLESIGFKVLERNYRSRAGEIDIVALDGETLVFVEVKTRRQGGRFGAAAEQVTRVKQRRIARTALAYITHRGLEGAECRFDVVAIDVPRQGAPRVSLVRGAFECGR